MPEDSYNLEFSADVRDFASKSGEVTENLNKVAEAVERVNAAGRKGGPASPYVPLIKEARQELAAIEKMAGGRAGDPYWAEAIKRKRAELSELQNKDRAEEAKKFKDEEIVEKRRETFRERLTRYRAGLESTLFGKVNKDRERFEDSVTAKQAARHRKETEFIRGVDTAASKVQRVLGALGFGRAGYMMREGLVSGASSGIASGMGITGGLALGGIGMLMAGGAAAAGATLWGARRAMSKNPAVPYNMELAGYVNPVEAMDKTRVIAKLQAEIEELKKNWYVRAGEWVGDAMLNVAGGMKLVGKIGPLIQGPYASLYESTKSQSQKDAEGKAQQEVDEWKRKVREDPTLGELRYWVEQSKQAIGPEGPQSEWGKMGLYATASEGIRVNRQDMSMGEMINSLREMTDALKRLNDRGILVDMGAANNSLTR